MNTTNTTFKKSLRHLLLFAALLVAGNNSLMAYDFVAVNADGDTIYYNITSSTTVSVTYRGPYNGNPYGYTLSRHYVGVINIPDSVTYGITYAVTSIGDYAFEGCYALTSVTIPNSVTSIGTRSFLGCQGLTSVTIPNSVTSIGYLAFNTCIKLTSVTIPNSVTSIGDGAFSAVKHIVYHGQATGAPWGACSMNGYIEGDFVYSDSTKTTLSACFANDTSITIPNTVTSIGIYAFSYCDSLTSITIPNSVTSIGGRAFYYCIGLTSVTIPNSVTSIGAYAFYYCYNLTSVSFATPSSLTTIGNGAFNIDPYYYGYHISVMELPNTVTTIGDGNFQYNDDYPFVGVDTLLYGGTAGSENETWGADFRAGAMDDEFFYVDVNKTKLKTARNRNITTLIIPATVTEIADEAFSDFPNLSAVTGLNNVTAIGDSAFRGCIGLSSIHIPNAVTTIGSYAFHGCTTLDSVTFATPSSLRTIGIGAFGCGQGENSGARNIRVMNLPYTVDTIKNHQVVEYDYDNHRYYYATYPPFAMVDTLLYGGTAGSDNEKWGANYRAGSMDDDFIYVDANKTKLKTAKNRNITTLTIPATVTEIASEAFKDFSNLSTVTIPSNVTHIRNNAFSECTGLTEVTFATPSNLVTIEYGAFCSEQGDNGIKNIRYMELPNSVDTLDWEVFTMVDTLLYGGTAGYETEKWGANFRAGAMDDEFFYVDANKTYLKTARDRNIATVTIPAIVTRIGGGAFEEFTNLTTVTMPTEIYRIGDDAFAGCTALTSIQLPDSLEWIEDGTFLGCTALTSVHIPGKVEAIYDGAFYGCTGLTEVTFATPSSLTEIGIGVFGCEQEENGNSRNISVLELPESVTTINDDYDYYSDYTLYPPFNMVDILLYSGTAGSKDSTWGANYRAGAMDDDFFYVDADKTILRTARDKNITAVTIPATVIEVDTNAFKAFPNLTTVIVPDNVALIHDSAFIGCSVLDSISLGTGLNRIGASAFAGCNNLFAITSHRNMPPTIAATTFDGVNRGIPVYVPENSLNLYHSADYWEEFNNIQALSNNGGGSGDDTGIEDATVQQATVRGTTGAIVLDAAEGRTVRIYNVQGNLVWQGQTVGEQRIDVSSSGLYFVVIEGMPTQKVVVMR